MLTIIERINQAKSQNLDVNSVNVSDSIQVIEIGDGLDYETCVVIDGNIVFEEHHGFSTNWYFSPEEIYQMYCDSSLDEITLYPTNPPPTETIDVKGMSLGQLFQAAELIGGKY